MTAVAMTEGELQEAIIDLAMLTGWLVHHDRPARSRDGWRTAMQGHVGFPDLCLARNSRVIFAELKRETESATPDQLRWLTALGYGRVDGYTGALAFETYLWRPSDWLDGRIEYILKTRR